jgi:hypothetical protein
MDSVQTTPPRASFLDWLFRVLGFLALVAIAFSLPAFPAAELDASWRMVLGKFFQEGRQFGTEVIFTYGPLGFTMGKTYWGGQWASLIGWHAVQAVVFAAIVYWHAYRLTGYNRVFFLIFFFTFGLTYEDAMHQIMIVLAGLELIRRSHEKWQWSSVALVLLMAVLSLVKFTNMLLCLALVMLAAGLELWTRRRATALRIPLLFVVLFLLGWKLCGQQIGNIPAYLHGSWEISQGYQDTMGYSCPSVELALGLTVLGLIIVYTLINFLTAGDRVRSAALTLGVGAFIYLNWKHGFIRADGHQMGFYFAALTVAVSSPLLLEDGPRLRLIKQLILGGVGVLSLFSMEKPLPGVVRGILGGAQHEINQNVAFALGLTNTRALYDVRLRAEKDALDLLKTKAVVGRSSLDVLGFEQAVALLNEFNYQPRPVFQGYSAYTPYLSHLNHDYFASDQAPEFVLFKLQTLDGRLHTMDDPHVLRILVQRYTYLFSELGFTLWQRKPGPYDAAAFEPKPLRSVELKLGEVHSTADFKDRNLWVEIEYNFNLLGKLRRFFFKPPLVQLKVTDDKGVESLYRLPQPIGRTGFMLNPLIEDLSSFMRAAGGVPKRQVVAIAVVTAPQDADCLRDGIKVRFAELPRSDAGVNFFKQADQALFHMFTDAPVSYQALNPPNEDQIDKRKVMVMHAPSEMIFEVPPGATEVVGAYGYLPGAYTEGGRTNGAEFVIYCNRDGELHVLHERYLDPLRRMNDRGLQKFVAKIPHGTERIYMRINPGPFGEYAFDWTGWTGIEFK